MNFRQFLAIIRARLGLVLLTLIIAVASAAVLTYREPNRYVGTAFLLLNYKEGSPFESTPIPAQLSSSYLETQLDIIRSQKVALKVVELLKLDEAPGWRAAYASAGTKEIAIKDWIATQVARNVQVESLSNSRVVSVSYSALSPKEAARIANAYAQAFIATTLELTVEPARRNAAWFDEQLKVLRARLEAARARVTEFQVEQGIVALDEKLGSETTRLQDISRNLVEAQTATYAVRARQLGVNHPEYVSAVQRERALAQSLANQKQNILMLEAQRDKMEALTREVESEQRNYDATLQSYYRSAMESQFNQTNIAVLSLAQVPLAPDSPRVALNMISAALLGVIFGLLVAVLAELVSPRVRPEPVAA